MSRRTRRWSRPRLARGILRRLRLLAGQRAVPLDVVRAVRLIGGSPLAPVSRPTDASSLHARPLAALLAGIELGTWALGPRSIDEIVGLVERVRPDVIIEFGSGSSTVALAWAIRESRGASEQPRIVSLEQDADQARRTRDLLLRAGLQTEAVVLVAPLEEQVIEGRRTTCYAPHGALADALHGRSADLIVIDGPAGPAGVRFGTLPLAHAAARDGATFLLDDALRDGELEIARLWAGLPWVHLRGIRLVEHGLLLGTVVNR